MAIFRRSSCIIILSALLISLLTISYGCDRSRNEGVSEDEERTLVVPVKVKPVSRKDFITYIEATGRLRAKDDVLVKSEVAGVVEEVPLSEGDAVQRGQLLARVNQESYRYNLDEAKAALNFARADLRKVEQIVRPQELEARKAALESARAAYEKARKDWERIQRLYRQAVISREVYDLNRSQMEVAEANHREAQENYKLAAEGAREEDIQMARAKVKQAEAKVGLAEKMLRDCNITSPITGRVARILVEQGETIAIGSPIANVVNTEILEIEVGVVQEDVVHLREGDLVSISVNVYPDRDFVGTVTYAGIKAEGRSGSFPVIIEVNNGDQALRPGMIATIRLSRQAVSGALVVPRDAVLENRKEFLVFTVSDGVARRRPVSMGVMQDQEVVIKVGLEEGELVVVEGQESLQDMTRVSVQNEEM
jgi:multidrug efflux pump subunit AcrA (membrane-fusion protein)